MGSFQAIANYELLSALTGQMREAAMLDDWDRLIGIERQRSDLVESMKAVDAEAKLDAAERGRKARLIAQVMDADTEIRVRVQRWMGQLQHELQSNRQEQRVLKAYGV
ncbi:MAG: flagellar protein FliT [Sulfuritalea sp.]|nr:flagellar protein FliT [Sulfuritalea sp.]